MRPGGGQKTHALVDSNIQVSSKDILIQLGIHFPLTMECAIDLIVIDALQMLLLLLPYPIRYFSSFLFPVFPSYLSFPAPFSFAVIKSS